MTDDETPKPPINLAYERQQRTRNFEGERQQIIDYCRKIGLSESAAVIVMQQLATIFSAGRTYSLQNQLPSLSSVCAVRGGLGYVII